MSKLILLASVALVGGNAFASFELVMAADNGSSTTATRKIHRFDGDSGVYLGSFGAFNTDIREIQIKKGTNEAWVLTNGRMFVYDYNSGQLIADATVSATSFALDMVNSNIYFVNGTNVISSANSSTIYSGFLSPSTLYTDPGATSIDRIAKNEFGVFLTHQVRAGTSYAYKYNSTFNGNGNTITYTAGSAPAQISVSASNSFLTTSSFIGIGRGSYIASAGTTFLASFTLNSLASATGAAGGHVGGYYTGKDITNTNRGLITRVSMSGAELNSFGSTVLVNPVSMASVVAPEPGTILALSAGIGAFLFKRRKRA